MGSDSVVVRPERAGDEAAIAAVNDAAFGGMDESAIVARLRDGGLVAVSLVAEERGRLVGHILFSWLPVEIDGRPVASLALAPMAVVPSHQRAGIGTMLGHAGIAAAPGTGAASVIVVGHPEFYPRFGFSAARAAHLAAPFSGPAFMALELVPGALDGARGSVTYPAAFGL